MARLPPYLYSDDDRPPDGTVDTALARRRRTRLVVVFVALAVVCGAVGASLDHVISSDDSTSPPRAAASSTTRSLDRAPSPTPAHRVYAVHESVRIDSWSVVVRGYRVATLSGDRSAPAGSMWLLVEAEITNQGAGNRQLSPETLEVRYQLPTSGYAIKAPDDGIAPVDEIGPHVTVHRTLGYVIPDGANGFVVLFRAGVGAEEAHGRAAQINLSCC